MTQLKEQPHLSFVRILRVSTFSRHFANALLHDSMPEGLRRTSDQKRILSKDMHLGHDMGPWTMTISSNGQ
jgi:hypothetical protein